MKLVIVESPAKTKTLLRYLGEDYKVMASVGHIRDLAIKGKNGYGVDTEDNFAPSFSINKDKRSVVTSLKTNAKKADEVILATDPDREGEAIAWHLAQVLNLDVATTKRLDFHEITRDSISYAMENPRTIDMNLVSSQEARRIIDRIIGFSLSSITKKIIKSQSAGRVQSVTLKLICDHEKEILAFVPQDYYSIKIYIEGYDKELSLFKYDGKKIDKIYDKELANKIFNELTQLLTVEEIVVKERKVKSKDPYITSTLQQDAFNKFGYKTRETSAIAQKLYEGVETDEGLVGLITYMRTDSTKLSDSFINRAKAFVEETIGLDYFDGAKLPKHKKNAQEAHEAIRHTSNHRTPALMKKYLDKKEYNLYKLIYERALSSLLKDKIVENSSIILVNGKSEFKIEGNETVYDGYTKIWSFDEKDIKLDKKYTKGSTFNITDKSFIEDKTKPSPRYSEAKIVNLMESQGIGRPSTYASTIQTLLKRRYIVSEKGILSPTEQGMITSDFLVSNFSDLVNVDYTAKMEQDLDNIQSGNNSRIDILQSFYNNFSSEIEDFKQNKMETYAKIEPTKTGEKCPICGSDLVVRQGRYGSFVGCSNYPTCKYIKKKELEYVGRKCPDCGGELVYRYSKRGKFISCSNFPKCKHIESIEKQNDEVKD